MSYALPIITDHPHLKIWGVSISHHGMKQNWKSQFCAKKILPSVKHFFKRQIRVSIMTQESDRLSLKLKITHKMQLCMFIVLPDFHPKLSLSACFTLKTGPTTGCDQICRGGYQGDECGGASKLTIVNITTVSLVQGTKSHT